MHLNMTSKDLYNFVQTSCVDSLQWRLGVSNHQPHDCLRSRWIKAQIKEDIKAPRHWILWGEFTGEFPAQMATNMENVSI